MAIGQVKTRGVTLPKTGEAHPARETQQTGKKGWIAEQRDKFIAKIGLTAFAPMEKPPVLKKPVVMIPGLTMPASSYDPLARNLATEKANGPVATFVAATGQFHYGGTDGRVMSDQELKTAKIFQLEYKNAKAAPTEKAPQIAAMLAAVTAKTGGREVDVVTHSAGGHDFREYLDTRAKADANIGKLVMIGPVTHGTVMGNIGSKVGGPLGLKEASDQLGIGDEKVKHLDAAWPKALAQISGGVNIIGVSGAPTLGPVGDKGHLGFQTGDGYVQADELGLPGAKVKVLKGADPTPLAHLKEVGYSGVVNEVQAVLGK
jgi:pimeloyl-ACP methyl ester carboxylesterase